MIRDRDRTRITLQELKEILEYNPNTGVFVWLKSLSNKGKAGSQAGSLDAYGYRQIMIRGKNYKASHLAWLYTYGVYPTLFIDHINELEGKDSNRIGNLREATNLQNSYNKGVRSTSESGYKCVYRRKDTGKYSAYIKVNGKRESLGCYLTAEEAALAYIKRAEEVHGEFYHEPNLYSANELEVINNKLKEITNGN